MQGAYWGSELRGSAPVGTESSRVGNKGKLNCNALKQRPLLNLKGPLDDLSNLIRIGERERGLHSHPPSLSSHCLQAFLRDGSDLESGGSFSRGQALLRALSCQHSSSWGNKHFSPGGGNRSSMSTAQMKATSKANASIKSLQIDVITLLPNI